MQNDKILVIALVIAMGAVSIGCSYVWTHQSEPEPEPEKTQWDVGNGCYAVYDVKKHSLSITGPAGASMRDYSSTELPPWLGYHIVEVRATVSVGDYAFYGCSSVIYASLSGERVGEYAFYGCSALLSASCYAVRIYEQVCFADCVSLGSVFYDHDAELDVDPTAFNYDPNLKSHPPYNPIDTSEWE